MKKLRAVLFDLDGVLVDSYQVWYLLMKAAALRFSAPPVDSEVFSSMWGQGLDADAHYLGCDVERLEKFYNEYFMSFGDALGVDPAGGPLIVRLRAAGIRTAVITNTPGALTSEILAVARLGPEVVVGGTDVPRPKPAPDMVFRACELLEVEPAEAVVVGDSSFDREAAAAAGADFIGLRIDGTRRIERLEQLSELLGL